MTPLVLSYNALVAKLELIAAADKQRDDLKVSLEVETKFAMTTAEHAVSVERRFDLACSDIDLLISAGERQELDIGQIVKKNDGAAGVAPSWQDLYFDDDAWSLYKSRCQLRLRLRESRQSELTAKIPLLGVNNPELAARLEVSNTSCNYIDIASSICRSTPYAVLSRHCGKLDADSLRPRLQISSSRSRYRLLGLNGERKYLITVDRVESRKFNFGLHPPAVFFELEIEAEAVNPLQLAPFLSLSDLLREKLDLKTQSHVKSEIGLRQAYGPGQLPEQVDQTLAATNRKS